MSNRNRELVVRVRPGERVLIIGERHRRRHHRRHHRCGCGGFGGCGFGGCGCGGIF